MTASLHQHPVRAKPIYTPPEPREGCKPFYAAAFLSLVHATGSFARALIYDWPHPAQLFSVA